MLFSSSALSFSKGRSIPQRGVHRLTPLPSYYPPSRVFKRTPQNNFDNFRYYSTVVRRPPKNTNKDIKDTKKENKKEEFVTKIDSTSNLFKNLETMDMSNFTKEEIEETIKLLKEDYEKTMASIDKKYDDEDEEEDEGEELEEVVLEFPETYDPDNPVGPKLVSSTPLSKGAKKAEGSAFVERLKKKNAERGIETDKEERIDEARAQLLENQIIEYLDDTNRVDFSEASINAVELLFDDDHFRDLQARVRRVDSIAELAEIEGSFSPDQFVEMLKMQNAEEILALDIRKKSNWLSYVILCTAHSERHRRSIAEFLRLQIRKRADVLYHDVSPKLRSFLQDDDEVILSKKESSEWIVVDSDKINIYIFEPEIRKEYDIEGLWLRERPELPSTNEEIKTWLEEEERPHKDLQIVKKVAARKSKYNNNEVEL